VRQARDIGWRDIDAFSLLGTGNDNRQRHDRYPVSQFGG
jgi:hypothetical protein